MSLERFDRNMADRLYATTSPAKEVSRQLADRAESVAAYLLPNGKRKRNDWVCGNVRGDEGQSLKVTLTGEFAGRWEDYATGERGDLLDLWKEVRGMDTVEAIKDANHWLGNPTPPPPKRKSNGTMKDKKTVHTWHYPEKDGIKGRTVRKENGLTKNGKPHKEIIPYFHADPNKSGIKPEYIIPLYGRTGNFVFITEGEKCADALLQMNLHAVTCQGSKGGIDRADWSMLDRTENICLMPDNDTAGDEFIEAVAKVLKKRKPDRVLKILKLEGLKSGGDIVDWVQFRIAGWDGYAADEKVAGLRDEFLLTAKGAEPYAEKLLSRRMSSFRRRGIDWIWKYKIPRGKLTLLAGMPSLGKSQISIDIIARVTTGAGWPDGDDPKPPRNVIILTTEDDPEDTIGPRLVAAGADLDRVHLFPSVVRGRDGKDKAWTIAEDIRLLEREVRLIGNVALINVDPMSAYLGANNSWNEAEVRGIMAPFSDFAAKHRVAVLGLAHLTKNNTADTALQRIAGSVAIGALARSVYLVLKEDDTRYFLNAKPSVMSEENASGFAYSIKTRFIEGEDGQIETSRIEWEEPCNMTADEMLATQTKKTRPASDPAKDWLMKYLRNGAQPASEIIKAGIKAGHSKRTLERLRDAREVFPRKAGFGGKSYWYTPEQFERLMNQKESYRNKGAKDE